MTQTSLSKPTPNPVTQRGHSPAQNPGHRRPPHDGGRRPCPRYAAHTATACSSTPASSGRREGPLCGRRDRLRPTARALPCLTAFVALAERRRAFGSSLTTPTSRTGCPAAQRSNPSRRRRRSRIVAMCDKLKRNNGPSSSYVLSAAYVRDPWRFVPHASAFLRRSMSPEPVAARLGSYSHLDTLRSEAHGQARRRSKASNGDGDSREPVDPS